VQVELRQLRYFVAVAEELHFRRAAERLLLTQPALSHQIARLERQLGVRLLERDRRSVALTPAGATLLEGARRALFDIDQSIAATRWTSGITSHVLLLLPPEVPEPLLPELACRPVDLPPRSLTFTLAWHSGNPSPPIKAFSALMRANSPVES
jgi:DNA-binding transcriptional LysR family regulator